MRAKTPATVERPADGAILLADNAPIPAGCWKMAGTEQNAQNPPDKRPLREPKIAP